MSALARLSEDTWFALGDGDLATHVERTRRLRSGETLSAITASFCRRLGIATRVLPMSDEMVQTRIVTDHGALDFQDYFVRQRCAPAVRGVRYEGAVTARAHPTALAALRDRELRAVVICPSNPLLSIAPMLALADLREALVACAAPVIAVSPIIAGRAVKGPTAKMMAELGLPVSAVAIARYYDGLIDGYVLDDADAGDAAKLDLPVMTAKTLMETLEHREALALSVLAHADALAKPP
jgi:LPPG:FO 2-phospho-L-lactate transferase